jgi:flavin-dependent dehydrogenase
MFGVYDVVVVGAGPAGSALATALAEASFRVALLEEHPAVGLPNHCSGLVSPRTLETAGVAEATLELARFMEARVWGPGGKTLWVKSDSVQAVAIDRPRFDQILADRAAGAGATLLLDTKAHHFERVNGHVRVEARQGGEPLQLQASLLVGADGANSGVARWMRGGPVGNHVAPGWFGWIIPLPGGRARIGIGTTRSLRSCFADFLDLIRRRFGAFHLHEERRAPIPLGPARDFVADRVMLVGAAAGQTKPTTGGGIYLSLRAARLAAATAARALEGGDCSYRALAEYERAWHRLEGHEVLVGHWLRRLYLGFADRELDLIIQVMGEPWAQGLIARLGDLDFPSGLLSSLVVSALKHRKPSKVRQVWGLVNRTMKGEMLT